MDTQPINGNGKDLLREAQEKQRSLNLARHPPEPKCDENGEVIWNSDPKPEPVKSVLQSPRFVLPPPKPKYVDPRTPEQIKADELARETAYQERCKADATKERLRVWGMLRDKIGPRYDKRLSDFEFYGIPEHQSCQHEVVGTVQKFHESMLDNVQSGRGILFVGSRGTGKDFMMATCLKRAVGVGFRPQWMDGSQLFLELRNTMNKTGTRTEAQIMWDLSHAKVLAISDPVPAMGNLSEYQASALLSIVDVRYRAELPTWITLNVSSRKEAETRMGAMLIDRLFENAEVLFCAWPSYREYRREQDKAV